MDCGWSGKQNFLLYQKSKTLSGGLAFGWIDWNADSNPSVNPGEGGQKKEAACFYSDFCKQRAASDMSLAALWCR